MTTAYISQTQFGKLEEFNLQVARGQIQGHSTVNIYGYQGAISTTSVPVWENVTAYTFPASAITMYVSGTNGDTCRITVIGLDLFYRPISETVVMTGATPAATTKQYLRINSMFVAPTSLSNPAGVVYLKNLAATVTYAQINAGIGRTQMAIYTVPADYTFYLQRVALYTSLNGNDYVTYRNRTTSPTGVVQVTQQAPLATLYDALRIMPRPFLEKTDIELFCAVKNGTGAVAVAQEGYLIKNDTGY